ncbi:MAG: MOSC domain-containing protein [Chloroflexi bacterium]|nr:MOSC domain-containing protein [Chloroflexota bacterium]
MSKSGRVVAVCVSKEAGTPKQPIAEAALCVNWGIHGDAHAGQWHRQVSLLAMESINKIRAKGLDVGPGSFAENITTEGVTLHTLPIGTRLLVGGALAEVTQIGKECHARCAIYEAAGDCVMPREGIFVRILEPGMVRAGSEVTVLGCGPEGS